ncbi:hypothetical protein HQ533_00705 [Candidatus Woesearchaeota archaeon]|nr:hypothetical protein [Candidatus Woesearchaeota archaeon]
MVNHGHDIHYMLVVLILAFFIITLSIDQVQPGITANVVNEGLGAEGLLVKFLRSTAQNSQLRAVNADNLFNPIAVKTVSIPWKEILGAKAPAGNIGGKAIATPVTKTVVESKPLNCEWVNLDNNVFDKVKALSGSSACRFEGFDSCLMTNHVKTTTYYASNDGTCRQLVFKDQSNNFDDCRATIQTQHTGCFTESRDLMESSYTTVFCCK